MASGIPTSTIGNTGTCTYTVDSATVAIARAIVAIHIDKHSHGSDAEKLQLQEAFLRSPEMTRYMEQINPEVIRLVHGCIRTPSYSDTTPSLHVKSPTKPMVSPQLQKDNLNRLRDVQHSAPYERWIPDSEEADETSSSMETGWPAWIGAIIGSGSDSERLNQIFEEFKGQLR